MHRAAGLMLTFLLMIAAITPALAQDWTVIPMGTTATLRGRRLLPADVRQRGQQHAAVHGGAMRNRDGWSATPAAC